MSQPVIELRNVSKYYGELCAVDHISLQVEEGNILALLGASGCGKTSTLRLIAGLEMPDSGRIMLNGDPVANENRWVPPEERHVGMVFQDYALFPHLTIAQNITFPLNKLPRKKRQTRVEELLALVGLPHIGERYPHQLSGGQQQRIALARALAPSPDVILLDEPFSNLDAALRKSTRTDVRRILKETGTTAIFVTHDQEEALSIADKVGILRLGKLIQIGTPRTLYNNPISPIVATFLGSVNKLQGSAEGETVHTALGQFPLKRPQHGPVEVYIRPENLIINGKGDITGTVIHQNFLGNHQLLWIDIEGVGHVEVDTSPHQRYEVNDPVQLSVYGDVIAFPTSAEPPAPQ